MNTQSLVLTFPGPIHPCINMYSIHPDGTVHVNVGGRFIIIDQKDLGVLSISTWHISADGRKIVSPYGIPIEQYILSKSNSDRFVFQLGEYHDFRRENLYDVEVCSLYD